jgi:hypothetical protein
VVDPRWLHPASFVYVVVFLVMTAPRRGSHRSSSSSCVSRIDLVPDLEDHVFVVEVEQWVSQHHRERRRNDLKKPASEQALWRMVEHVCRRAGVRVLSPHQLRQGFANRFIRESCRDFVTLRALMGIPGMTPRRRTQTRSISKNLRPRSIAPRSTGTHKRRRDGRQSTCSTLTGLKPLSAGDGFERSVGPRNRATVRPPCAPIATCRPSGVWPA